MGIWGARADLTAMRFGQYELFDRFAVGDMAELYMGRALGEEGFEKPVAIKRILPHLAADERFVRMLLTEARIHASLSHKNIVQIHDLGISAEGEHFIVLEYVDGRDLGELLAVLRKSSSPDGLPKRLDDAVALYILGELCEGVHFAHELRGPDGRPTGLVHRDISPDNVLLSYAGEVKLSDFGVAKRRTDNSVVSSLKGNLAYMSPEQARGAALDRRSDIYSLGAVLFELLTGYPLRDSSNQAETWRQVASGLVFSPQQHRPNLPPPLARLIAGSLAPDPRDRFPDARVFADACRTALDLVQRPSSGEATELKLLLRTLLPPGSASKSRPASKVIRLAPDLWADETAPESAIPVRANVAGRAGAGAAQGKAGGPASAGQSPRPSLAAAQGAVLVAPPQMMNPRPTLPTPFGAAATGLTPALPSVTRRRGLWAPVLVALLFVLAAAAVLVHMAVVPLPVAAVWFQPATLLIESQPAGAEVVLDGMKLSSSTPVRAQVRRDLAVHAVDMRKQGFLPASRAIRYDRAVDLALSVALEPGPVPAPKP
jgi:eukaryotic-like serine/threonine-protein kinase